jgi:hypothetical protein
MPEAVDLATCPIQVALQIPSLPPIQAVTGSTIDTFLCANRGSVGAQSIKLATRDLVVLSSLANTRGLTPLASVDPRTMMHRRIVRVLGKGDHGRREHESKHCRNQWPNRHVVPSFATLARRAYLSD